MAKRFEVSVCDSGQCEVVGSFRDLEKAKKRAAKEVKRRSRAKLKEQTPETHVHAEVRGVEGGMYDTQASYEVEVAAGAPKARGRSRRRPAQAAVEE
jgi:hypothetical protein